MKVAFYAASMLPVEGGGYTLSEDVLAALRECAGESHHTFEVYTRRGPAALRGRTALRERLTRGASRPVPSWLRRLYPDVLRSDRRGARRWQRRLEQDGIEVLWSALPEVPTLDVPYLVPVWDLEHRLQPYFPELSRNGEWRRREERFTTMLRRATFVITGTRAGADQIRSLYGIAPERIRILPHPTPGFVTAANSAAVDAVLAARRIRPPYLFYPAQFWAHKNHVGVLHAAREVRARTGVPLQVVFAGGDLGNAGHVRAAARSLGLADDVHMLGFVDRAELVALYRGALALAYLSFCGPENLPPLEAFAAGCPVIAADVPGAAEQLGDAALRVAPADRCAAARAVVDLLEDPARRDALIERGRARAQRFTAADYVRGVFQLLDEFEPIRRSWQ